MTLQTNRVSPESLDRLNPVAFDGEIEILGILTRLAEDRTLLNCGIGPSSEPRTARVHSVDQKTLALSVSNFEFSQRSQVFISFEYQSRSYFFSTVVLEVDGGIVSVATPARVYFSERRHRFRNENLSDSRQWTRVELKRIDGTELTGFVANWTETGIAVDVSGSCSENLDSQIEIRFLEGDKAGESAQAKVQHISHVLRRGHEWVRIGLSIHNNGDPDLIEIERRDSILAGSSEVQRSGRGAASCASAQERNRQHSNDCSVRGSDFFASDSVHIEAFENENGDTIVSIVDHWGEAEGSTAVVIPPAWGRTKETLMALALTIVESFRRAEEPITVLRFDGTNRRGESFVAPEFDRPGEEYLGFTFSQASRDISAAVDFLRRSPAFRPARTILVTFSLAAIEARHTIASDDTNRVAGWVSAVGMTDLQSALRTISGGVDYAYGLLSGVRFGTHELLGVAADMDRTGLDAIANRMVFVDDARREMKRINVPITWIHGRDDAWIDVNRARDILSFGDTSNRKLIEVPTGHQLRTSGVALQTFRLIAEEVSEIALGHRLPSFAPSRADIARRSAVERNRRPLREIDLRDFWGNYLLGRDRRIGIELLTATRAYRSLMQSQIAALGIENGDRIADLGAGTGALCEGLDINAANVRDVTICEFDFVAEVLRRNMEKGRQRGTNRRVRGVRAVSDLGLSRSPFFPLRTASFDSALASWLVGYLLHPLDFLREVRRLHRPGGRLVLSALKMDADISKLFVNGVMELKGSRLIRDHSDGSPEVEGRLFRNFLNDASQILNFEEEGRFRFWEAADFAELIRSAGFVDIRFWHDLGDPPQAIVVSAVRPNEN